MEILYNHGFSHTVKLTKERSLELFIFLYTFFSGFVFFEPGFSEIVFLVFLPFLAKRLNKTVFYITLLTLFLPGIISIMYSLIFLDVINIRFLAIDIYLFAFFITFASRILSIKDSYRINKIVDLTMISWTLSALVNIIAGILCFLIGRTNILGVEVIIYGIRLKGFFKDPNVLGPFLVVPAIWNFSKAYSAPKKIINWMLFIILSFGVLITFSRAAWLSLVITLLLFFILSLKKDIGRAALVFCLTLLTIIPLFSYFLNFQVLGYSIGDFLVGRAKIHEYDKGRFSAWKTVTKILTGFTTIFGTGPGNYEVHAGMATHSLFFRIIGERGMQGTLLFALFLWFIMYKTYKIIKTKNYWLVCSLFGQFVNSIFIDSLHWRHLWIMFGLIFSLQINDDKEVVKTYV